MEPARTPHIWLIAVALLAGCRPASPPTLVADYGFQNTLTSSIGSPPALVSIGPRSNTFGADTVDGASQTVLAFPQDNGLALSPTTAVLRGDRFSIVILFRLDTVTGYRRILDFKNGQDDCGLYVLDGVLDFFCDAVGSTRMKPDTWVQVVLTRDRAGNVTGYLDGRPTLAFADASRHAVIDANATLRFFQDNRDNECMDPTTCDETSAGAVARVRLYDGALSPAEVAALDRTVAVTTTTTDAGSHP